MKLLVLCTEANHSPLEALRDAAAALALETQLEQATSVGQLLISLQNSRYALTLLPGDTRSSLIDSIRRVHPGVPLALYLTSGADARVDKSLPHIQLEQLPADLARVLGLQPEPMPVTAELAEPLQESAPAERAADAALEAPVDAVHVPADLQFDAETVREVVAGLEVPEPVRQIMLIRDQRLQVQILPHEPDHNDNGTLPGDSQRRATTAPLDIETAELLAAQVASQFRGTDLSAQIHFFQEPGTEKSVIVYTRPLVGGYLLSVVAAPETSSGQLRGMSNALAHRLGQARRRKPAGQPEATILIDTPLPTGEPAVNPYVLAWQPRKPVPAALHEPLRLAAGRIAGANACHVRHLSLRPEYVQLVVSCPSGRNSAWVAHTFKRGLEAEIQQQFNIPARLWSEGYFARESLEPLDPAELQLFLNTPT